MCEICLQTPCNYRCPNADDEPVFECDCCGNDICLGEGYYKINDEFWCETCISHAYCEVIDYGEGDLSEYS